MLAAWFLFATKVGVSARAVRRYFGSRLGDRSYASVVVERRIDWR
jgi:hypothetical protein